jgi:hypothetical protein
LAAHEIGGQCRQAVVLTFRRPILDRYVAAFDIASFFETLPDSAHLVIIKARGIEQADYRQRRLLRAHGKGPRECRAGEQNYEIAPPHISPITVVRPEPTTDYTKWRLGLASVRVATDYQIPQLSHDVEGPRRCPGQGDQPADPCASEPLIVQRHHRYPRRLQLDMQGIPIAPTMLSRN